MILQGIRDSTTTPFSDVISGIASDGRTIEFKMCSYKRVESKASEALKKAYITVIITSSAKGLYRVHKNYIKGNGEVILINSFTDNGVDIMQKISPNEWRSTRSDTKSQLRFDFSIPKYIWFNFIKNVKYYTYFVS